MGGYLILRHRARISGFFGEDVLPLRVSFLMLSRCILMNTSQRRGRDGCARVTLP
jgi:hypothetical protein